ncbi:MAG: ribose 5-phosphate isomerase B [Vampirovibrionales bacterium]|nr:ribose 5-phosphate isomerase B [Vampirovibrionales bacterium]
MHLFLASDHAGYALKEALKTMLSRVEGLHVSDLGCASADVPADYPPIAGQLCQQLLASPDPETARGILVCGSGVGMAIAANRFNGVRAVLAHDLHTAALSRLHNNTNVLCLGARMIAPELASAIVETWLSTTFEADRHAPRVQQLDALGASAQVSAPQAHAHHSGCC